MILTQPERGYRYSLDPFLLAGFCRPRSGERILDLGAGVGVIGLLLAWRNPSVRVVGIELQPELAQHAAANARANALHRRCFTIRADVRAAPLFLPPEHFHRVVANPPFRRAGAGAAPLHQVRAGARQDVTFTLEDLARTSAALLRFSGTLEVIYLVERMPELWRALSAHGLEPKRLRLVTPFAGSAPKLCLVSAVKGGRPGLRVAPDLVLHRPGGRLADEAAALGGTRPSPS